MPPTPTATTAPEAAPAAERVRVPRPPPGERLVDLGARLGGLDLRYAEWHGEEGGVVFATADAPFVSVTASLPFDSSGNLTGDVDLRAGVNMLGLPVAEVVREGAAWDPGSGLPAPVPVVSAEGGSLRVDVDGPATVRSSGGGSVLPAEEGVWRLPLPGAAAPASAEESPHGVVATLAGLVSPSLPLEPEVRSVLERLMGRGLGGVGVHADAATDAALARLGADAATADGELYVRAGRAAPETPDGASLLLVGITQTLAGVAGVVDPTVRLEDPAQAEAEPVPAPPPVPEAALPAEPPAEVPPEGEAAPPAGAAPPAEAAPGPAVEEEAPPAEAEEAAAAEPGVELLMPPAPTAPSPAQEERIQRVAGTSARTGRAARDLPAARETTEQARQAVDQPTEQAVAEAQQELTRELGAQPPSPEIVALCDRIRAVIADERPDDEDELTSTDLQAPATAAGASVTQPIERDAQRIQQDYDRLNHPQPDAPAEGVGIETPSRAVADPGIAAEDAAPDPIPAEDLSLDADRAAVDQRIEESRIERPTSEPINEPPFSTVREGRGELGEMAAARPEALAAAQQQAITQARLSMGELQIRAVEALRQSRSSTVSGVRGRQEAMVESEEATRRRVSGEAQAIFDRTRTQVNSMIETLPQDALGMWTAGVATLSTEFRTSLDQVQSWIDDRHSGIGGWFVSKWDAVTGLPGWVTRHYDIAERRFGDGACRLLLDISSQVNGVIAAAQSLIETARGDIDELFTDLPAGLEEWAAGERARFGRQLDGLSQQVTEAQTSFVEGVSERAMATVEEVHAEVEQLREEAKGLIGRIADAIAEFLDDPIRAIINGLLRLLGIPPPVFWSVVEKIRQAISDIADDPVGFVGNLVAALKQGFEGFFERFEEHVIAGFWEWLFSGLGSVGVQLPSDYTPRSLITFALQLMGITWPRIREILVRHVGEENVALVEQAWELVSTLIEQGPEGIFNMLRERLDPGRILQEILEAAVEFMVEALIRQVAIRVIALFNPVGAIIQAIELIYKVLKWIFQNAARIFRLIEAVVNTIADIIAGNIGAVAAAVEGALASLVPIVIDFLAGLLGLGDLPDEIAGVIRRLQDFVLGIVDRIIGWLVGRARALLAALGLGEEEEEEVDGAEREDVELGASVPFAVDGERHRQWVDLVGEEAVLMVESTPQQVEARLAGWEGELDERFGDDDEARYEATGLIGSARTILNEADATADALAAAYANAAGLAPEEELPSDDPLERRQLALSRVLARLFEMFEGDPEELLESIASALPPHANVMKNDIHTRWQERLEGFRIGNKEDDERIWADPVSVLAGTEAQAFAFAQARATHERLLPYLTAAPRERDPTRTAFRQYAFIQTDAPHTVRLDFNELLGEQARVRIIASALTAVSAATKVDDDYKTRLSARINQIEFIPDAPGGGRFLLPVERIPDHTRYRPLDIVIAEAGGIRTVRYRTVTGQEFVITTDRREGLTQKVEGLGLRMMSGRGVTQDSPWFTSGEGLNRAHLIANEFGGSGYAAGENLATTSAEYNQIVMRRAELEIGESIIDFADEHGIDKREVVFNLTVTVTFGELLDPVVLAKIKEQEWFPQEAGGDLDAQILAKIDADEVHENLLRVTSVTYEWRSVTPPGLVGRTAITEDLWLLAQ